VTGSPLPAFNALTASAKIVEPSRRLAPKYDSWQVQLWDYYDRLGEYADGVGWLAKTMSRVRLCAAEVVPGGDEPARIDTGPAAEAVERLAGGTAGQSQLMKEATIHLSVPGECWLVGEQGVDEDRMAEEGLVTDEWWSVRSADEIKPSTRRDDRGRATFQVADEENNWRAISADSIVVRLWDPHPRFGWQADSWGRHALGAMLKLDMLNKRIIATIVSRLAGNGFLLYDSGRLSIPRNAGPTEDGQENPDPFAEQMVTVGGKSIADPMSAEALIPIPIGVDIGEGENFQPDLLMRHLTFDNPLDQKLLELREATIRELARDSDMPADVMLGLGDVNHWSAWQIEESGIKIHVSPKAETVVHGLTKGYLIPTLRAAEQPLVGPNGGRLIVWYDVSEITQRPDRSGNFVLAYDRFEVNGQALRREIGADEDDAPDKRELIEMIRKRIANNPLVAPSVLAALGDSDVIPPGDTEGSGEEETAEGDEQPETGPPDTQEDEPPAPDANAIAAALRTVVDRPVEEWTYDDISAALLQLGVNAEQAAMIAALKTLGEETRKSVFVPAGTPVENRATPARRNGTRTATDTTE
jgi:hypothetical protein